ncbi:MAG: glycosyltransferase family 2 protein, partial [Acidimicrobiales bacterium]
GLVTGHAHHHARRSGMVVVGYTPTVFPVRRSGADGTARLYQASYEEECRSWESQPRDILLNLWGGHFSMGRSDCLAVGLQSPDFPDIYNEDQDFGLRCRRAGLAPVFDRQLTATHFYRRSPAAFFDDARSSGMAAWLVHQLHSDLVGPLLPDLVALRWPRLSSLVDRSAAKPRFGAAVIASLCRGAQLTGRLHWWAAETTCLRAGRWLACRHGIRAAALAAGDGPGSISLPRRGGKAQTAGSSYPTRIRSQNV